VKTLTPTYWQEIEHIIGPAIATEFESIGQKPIREAIEHFILTNSNQDTILLDAGCNAGVEGYRLFQKGFQGKYVGVDSNPKALEFARQNLGGTNAEFILADCSSIDSPDKHFDIVLTKDVIEHAPYYEAILAELCRLTNRWLLLSMFIRPHDQPDFIKREPAGFHHNCYNRRKLYDFVCGKGFKTPEIAFSQFKDELLLFERE
jgi:ubiquinone/menaquinone biosynthesis C-methylase UbiE